MEDEINVLKCNCSWIGTEEDLIFHNNVITCPSCKKEDNFKVVINIKSDSKVIDSLIKKTIKKLKEV